MLLISCLTGASSKLLLVAGLLGFCPLEPRPHPFAAAAAEDCRQALLLACRQVNALPANRSVAHLQFTSRTVFRAPDQKRPREVVTPATLYAQGSKLFFQTPQVSLWQDGHFVATVMHSQQLIYITRVPPNGNVPGSPLQFAMLRDSLILRGRIMQCETTAKAGKSYRHVVLMLARPDQARYHALSLGFLLDNRSHMRELAVQYPDNTTVSQVVYTIERQEFIRSSAKLPSSARAMVVDKEGNSLPAYRNYRIVDHTMLKRLPY